MASAANFEYDPRTDPDLQPVYPLVPPPEGLLRLQHDIRLLSELRVPMLVVAGTADRRVPAVEEAERIARDAPPTCPCTVHLVEGAGHAGVTDDRLDLRDVMASWRAVNTEAAAASQVEPGCV